jgi:hypothetical protein
VQFAGFAGLPGQVTVLACCIDDAQQSHAILAAAKKKKKKKKEKGKRNEDFNDEISDRNGSEEEWPSQALH